MAIYLLDSDVIIDALNHKRGRRELLLGLAMERHVLACCSVQVTEVYAGTKPEDQVRTEELLAGLEFYEVDRETARKAGRLRRDHARRGVTLSLADATIAAVALSHHLTLITGNVKDYPMPELKLYR